MEIMRTHTASRWLLTAVALMFSTGAAAQLRINEIHYENVGVDTGEAIEIEGPAGTDITAYSLVLYNGSNGAVYNEEILIGTLPASCGSSGVFVVNYPTDGIQNGSPDAIALVDMFGTVLDFVSYEGVVTPTAGPAVGQVPTDILAQESSSTPIGTSLQRNSAGVWVSAASSFGACNPEAPPPAVVASVTVAPASTSIPVGGNASLTASAFDIASAPINGATFTWTSNLPAIASVSATGVVTAVSAGDAVVRATASNGVFGTAAIHVTAAPPPTVTDLHINEIHYDNVGVDAGEAIEIEGPAGTDITAYTLVLYNGSNGAVYNEEILIGTLAASCGSSGVFVVNYPTDGIQNGSPDAIALVDMFGTVLDFVSYEGVVTPTAGPAVGQVPTDILAQESSSTPIGTSLQRNSAGVWVSAASSFGACNPEAPPPAVVASVTVAPASTSIPVGGNASLTAAAFDISSAPISGAAFTWSSNLPAVASVSATGVVTAVSAGDAVIRATASNGVFGTSAIHVTAAPLPSPADLHINEIHYDNDGVDTG